METKQIETGSNKNIIIGSIIVGLLLIGGIITVVILTKKPTKPESKKTDTKPTTTTAPAASSGKKKSGLGAKILGDISGAAASVVENKDVQKAGLEAMSSGVDGSHFQENV